MKTSGGAEWNDDAEEEEELEELGLEVGKSSRRRRNQWLMCELWETLLGAAHSERRCRGSRPISGAVKLIITPACFFLSLSLAHCRELINDTPTIWISSSTLIYFVITAFSICTANYLLLCMWVPQCEWSIHIPSFYATNRRNFQQWPHSLPGEWSNSGQTTGTFLFCFLVTLRLFLQYVTLDQIGLD